MRFLRILFCVLAPLPGFAQLQVNNLQELLKYAGEHAPTAKQAKLQPSIARQDVNMAASTLYPRVNAFATADYNLIIPTVVIPAEALGGEPGSYLKAQFGLPFVFQAGTEVSMPIVSLDKWAQLSRAKAQYQQAQWSSKAALENFYIQLTQAYYQTLVSREVMKLNEENITTANELLRIMEARNEAGILDPEDYNRSKNLQLDVQTAGVNYRKTVQQSLNNLQSLLSVQNNISLNEDITGFTWPMLQNAKDVTTRAAWRESEQGVRVAELSLSEARKAGLPKLNLAGRYAYNMQSKLESGSNNVEFDAAVIGLRLDVPLFQGNYFRSLQKKSKLQLQSAQFERERTQATLTQQQEDWFDAYRAAYEKHLALEQKVSGASDNLRIAKLSLNEGLMEYDEFNNIFMEYNRARMEQLQNLADGILYYLLSTQNLYE